MVAYDQQYAVYAKAQRELEQLEALKSEVEELYKKRDVYMAYVSVLDWYSSYNKIRQEYNKCVADEADYKKRIASVVVDEKLSGKVSALQERQSELVAQLDAFAQLTRQKKQLDGYYQEVSGLADEKTRLEICLDAAQETKDNLKIRLDTRREFDQKKAEVIERDKARAHMQQDIES